MYEVHRIDAYRLISECHSMFRSEKDTKQYVLLASIAWMFASTGDGGGRNKPKR